MFGINIQHFIRKCVQNVALLKSKTIHDIPFIEHVRLGKSISLSPDVTKVNGTYIC